MPATHTHTKGSRLDEVERFELKGAISFLPKLTRANEQDDSAFASGS